MFYPRIDIVSTVVRWNIDKRRWYINNIKTRSDMTYSNRKIYKQKGTGLARHSTRSVPQFRGGGKYCGTKHISKLQVNKKLFTSSIKNILAIKASILSLFLADKISSTINNWSNSLVIHASHQWPLIFHLIETGCECFHWTKINIHLMVKSKTIIITRNAFVKLENCWTLSWQLAPKQSNQLHLNIED